MKINSAGKEIHRKENILTKFRKGMKVQVTQGFYRGTKGIIEDFNIAKLDTDTDFQIIEYLIVIKSRDSETKLNIREDWLKEWRIF